MSLRNPNLPTLRLIQPHTVEVDTVVKTRKKSGYLDQAVTPVAVAAPAGPHPAVVHDLGQLIISLLLEKHFVMPILPSLPFSDVHSEVN